MQFFKLFIVVLKHFFCWLPGEANNKTDPDRFVDTDSYQV